MPRKPHFDRLADAIVQVTALPPDERLEIYRRLRTDRAGATMRSNGSRVWDMKTKADQLVIRANGSIDVRAPTVFLSHSHQDKPRVLAFAKYLNRRGITAWIDEAEIRHGESLLLKIGDALRSVDLVLAFLSNNSISSQWVQRELEIATNIEFERRKVCLIPVLLDHVELPPFLSGKRCANFTSPAIEDHDRDSLVTSIKLLSAENAREA